MITKQRGTVVKPKFNSKIFFNAHRRFSTKERWLILLGFDADVDVTIYSMHSPGQYAPAITTRLTAIKDGKEINFLARARAALAPKVNTREASVMRDEKRGRQESFEVAPGWSEGFAIKVSNNTISNVVGFTSDARNDLLLGMDYVVNPKDGTITIVTKRKPIIDGGEITFCFDTVRGRWYQRLARFVYMMFPRRGSASRESE